jgi:hypothetical protein
MGIKTLKEKLNPDFLKFNKIFYYSNPSYKLLFFSSII